MPEKELQDLLPCDTYGGVDALRWARDTYNQRTGCLLDTLCFCPVPQPKLIIKIRSHVYPESEWLFQACFLWLLWLCLYQGSEELSGSAFTKAWQEELAASFLGLSNILGKPKLFRLTSESLCFKSLAFPKAGEAEVF